MDKRDDHIAQILWMEDAIKRTSSEHLRRDYRKAVRRMKKELRDYDRFKHTAGL